MQLVANYLHEAQELTALGISESRNEQSRVSNKEKLHGELGTEKLLAELDQREPSLHGNSLKGTSSGQINCLKEGTPSR